MKHTQTAMSVGSNRKATTDAGSTADDILAPPFFLVGSERSGTTMLRLMLNHHPLLRCGHETDFIVDELERYQATPREKLRHVWDNKPAFISYRASGLPHPPHVGSYPEMVNWLLRALREQAGKKLTGVTVHWHVEKLPHLAPDARYIHLLRDGRAVAASVVQMGWAGNTYHGALYWHRAVERVVKLQQSVDPVRWLEVRYEDLLSDVTGTLQRVCAFLGVPYDKQMLSYPETSTYDAPDAANANRWRKCVPPRDICYAEMAAGELLERMGYRRMFPPVHPGSVERLFFRVDDKIGKWRFGCARYGVYLLVVRKLWRVLGVRRPDLEERFRAIMRAHIK